jgi:hypothetical protein
MDPTTIGPTTSVDFATAGRILAQRASTLGFTALSFRSPPRLQGVRRSVVYNGDESVTVAVVVRDRPMGAVLADMIDGIVVASGADGTEASRLHDSLWQAGQEWLLTAPRSPSLLEAAA